MTELKNTVDGMLSDSYIDRFKSEYQQTKIRYERLKDFNNNIEASEKTANTNNPIPMPKHDCPSDILKTQQKIMGEYLGLLEVRAKIEGIDLYC